MSLQCRHLSNICTCDRIRHTKKRYRTNTKKISCFFSLLFCILYICAYIVSFAGAYTYKSTTSQTACTCGSGNFICSMCLEITIYSIGGPFDGD